MCQSSDKNGVDAVGLPGTQGSLFADICARQLKLATEESRVAMDGISEAVISANDGPSMDLIILLQSVDRFMQRLSNVQANLEHLAHFLRDSGNPSRGLTWTELVEQARATFTMEHEREIFDTMLGDSDHCGLQNVDTLKALDDV